MTARPTNTVRLPRSGTATSELVVEAIATCMDDDPTDLGVTLYDSVDPDALDRLFRAKSDGTPRAKGRVVFQMGECRVEVTDETVSVSLDRPA